MPDPRTHWKLSFLVRLLLASNTDICLSDAHCGSITPIQSFPRLAAVSAPVPELGAEAIDQAVTAQVPEVTNLDWKGELYRTDMPREVHSVGEPCYSATKYRCRVRCASACSSCTDSCSEFGCPALPAIRARSWCIPTNSFGECWH